MPKGNILIPILVAVFILAAATFFIAPRLSIKESSQPIAPTISSSPYPSSKITNTDEPPLLLKSIGVNLDYYDPKTEKAGDFKFTKQKLQFDRVFMPYGFVIPASSAGDQKSNPQPTFVVPTGTKVTSLVDGTVARISKVWSGDYSIQVTANGQIQKWVYETEHVINPMVKEGDKVKAGQPIADPSNFDRGTPEGFSTVEIGILKGGQMPQHVCPFAYLDPTIKEETFAKIKALYKAWQDYLGDNTLYTETKIPGCLTLDFIDG